ncbi:unnamed protein product [Urochloa decumbens]|uniref:Uncharacterized protein n=1 Tax=Urochloa decumbens TaxID=240449 RepID=A0ABC9BDH9_9POAL
MEAEQRSTQLWERLRRASETKELLAAEAESWDRSQHGAGEDDDLERREPVVSRWRWLKAVSMVAFSGRPAYKMQIEPSRQPAKSRSDDVQEAAESDLGANRAQPRTTTQVQALISPRHVRSNNPVPQIVMDVATNVPQSTQTAQVLNLLSPRRAAKFESNNPVHEVAMDVASNHPQSTTETAQVAASHGPTVDQKKEEQKRCFKYSQKALGFAVCTLIGYASAISLARNKDNESKGDTTFKIAIAPFIVAMCTDLFSLKTKAKQGNILVYISSFHLVLMIYLIFISFNRDYAYAILFLPLVVGFSLLQTKIWPEGHRQSIDEKLGKELDSIFELSTLILNWSTFISAIMAIFRDLIPGENQFISLSPVGFLFFLTIILGLYLMFISTVRTMALNLRPKYLDVLLMFLLASTVIAALITFVTKE